MSGATEPEAKKPVIIFPNIPPIACMPNASKRIIRNKIKQNKSKHIVFNNKMIIYLYCLKMNKEDGDYADFIPNASS